MLDRDIAILILRVVGLLFIGHGAQKLFGWFGGQGLAGTAQWLGSLGLQPARFWAIVAGLAELLGGIGLALGLFTPIAAAAIIAVMLMAIIRVHWANGLWVSKGGMEYPLVNILVSAFIGLTGAGRYALDTALNITYPMPQTFWVALAVGVVGVIIGLVSGQRVARPQARAA